MNNSDKTFECAIKYLDKLYADICAHSISLSNYYKNKEDSVCSRRERYYINDYGSRISYYADALNVVRNMMNQWYDDGKMVAYVYRDENGKHQLEYSKISTNEWFEDEIDK